VALCDLIVPVIATSGGMGPAGIDPLRIASLLGAGQALAKPFRIDQLLESLPVVLSAAPAEPRKALPGSVALAR